MINLNNIPNELRMLNHWVLADMSLNEKGYPKKFPLNPRTGALADVTNPLTWGSFEEVIRTGSQHIGFVLHENDPYTIIDLDDKLENPATDEEKIRFKQIIAAFNSYTEVSSSGRGVHIVVKGKIPKGVHRSHVEVYSTGRYMIFTGNVIKNYPIENRQELLDVIYKEMQPVELVDLEQVDSEWTDAEICERASNAVNGDKYNALCSGDITGYPSQSEADFALMSMIAFYTKDNEQAIRLFKMTALGKREKAQRQSYYIGKYGMLNKIRANQVPIDFEAMKANAESILRKPELEENENKLSPYTTPPGLVGELTEYFMSTAIRPVHEIALAAALTVTAGVSSRSFNISGTGLNLYIILLAGTGSGKEGALSGIEKLIAATRSAGVPLIEQFIGPAAFSSGQALIKVLSSKPCFFSVLGEFGITLQEMSDPRSNSAVRMLKRVLLDLYSKSGINSILRSSVYSDEEKNTKIVQSPNLTILGESTPETFYEALSESQISDGLIPRFSIIEYQGARPTRNHNSGNPPSKELVANFVQLVAVSLTATNNNTFNHVAVNSEAQHLLDELDLLADETMRAANNEATKQLWNRVHLKALKVSALIAVGVNPMNPIVDKECALWAINFVKNDVNLISARFKEGDVGNGETKQFADLKRTIISYFEAKAESFKAYKGYVELHKAGLIPHSHLSRRLSGMASYRTDRVGSTLALKRNIQLMVDNGMLKIVTIETENSKFETGGICYSIKGNGGWA